MMSSKISSSAHKRRNNHRLIWIEFCIYLTSQDKHETVCLRDTIHQKSPGEIVAGADQQVVTAAVDFSRHVRWTLSQNNVSHCYTDVHIMPSIIFNRFFKICVSTLSFNQSIIWLHSQIVLLHFGYRDSKYCECIHWDKSQKRNANRYSDSNIINLKNPAQKMISSLLNAGYFYWWQFQWSKYKTVIWGNLKWIHF